MPARMAALGLLLALLLVPSALRGGWGEAARRRCPAEGRGVPPHHWLGCAGDPGPRRDLAADERLALGLPIDPNTAGERDLALVPGLSARLARAVVEHRRLHGPFGAVDDLLAVKGIGPRRLDRARARLAVGPP
jgi:competence protein ComEA